MDQIVPENVLVTGNFNVLHAGHIRLLEFAKKCGKRLVVGVNSDSVAGGAVQVDQNSRMRTVQSIGCVDQVVLNEGVIGTLIENIRPDVVVKGKEYEFSENEELKTLQTYGGKLVFSSGEVGFSFTEDKPNQFMLGEKLKSKIHEFMARHKFGNAKMVNVIKKFAQKRVCVIGDLIVDEYIDCFPLGLSEEDPTIVVTPTNRKRYIGGAGIVASHAAGLGANVKFISVSGQDDTRDFAVKCLEENDVDLKFLIDSNRQTSLKQRYRSNGKTLLRVSNLTQKSISLQQQGIIYDEVLKSLGELDVLIFSDFSYGALPQAMVKKILNKARFYPNLVIAADSQSSSQTGDIKRFEGMNLITPTEKEARLSLRNQEDGLVVLADQLLRTAEAENILLKLGGEGVILHTRNPRKGEIFTDRINALNLNPIDVSGAGDSMLISSTLALSCGANIWVSGLIGSLAAALQVSRVGNIPLKKEELLKAIPK